MNQNVLIAAAAGGAVLLILIIALLVRRSRKNKQQIEYATPDYYVQENGAPDDSYVVAPQNAAPPLPTEPVQPPVNTNPYERLRTNALQTTARALGIPVDGNTVSGVVMDWNLGDSVVTLAAFANGDASLYFSNGGTVKAGLGHEVVRTAAKNFVAKAQDYISSALPTTATILPPKDNVTFYFITGNGLYRAQESVPNFYNESSKWKDIFEEGDNVINELNLIAEDAQ